MTTAAVNQNKDQGHLKQAKTFSSDVVVRWLNMYSFYEMGKEMSDSRVFGGIYYQASCDKGNLQGKKVGQNILSTVKFLK